MVHYQFQDGQVTVANDRKAPLINPPKQQFTEPVVLLMLGNMKKEKEATQNLQKVEEE